MPKKTGVRATSLLAYAEVLMTIDQRQMQVLKAIKEIQPCNNMMIQKKIGLPINCITPRVYELRKEFDLVREIGKQLCPYTNRLTQFYAIKKWIQEIQ